MRAILIEVSKLWQQQTISCDAEIKKSMFNFLCFIEKDKKSSFYSRLNMSMQIFFYPP